MNKFSLMIRHSPSKPGERISRQGGFARPTVLSVVAILFFISIPMFQSCGPTFTAADGLSSSSMGYADPSNIAAANSCGADGQPKVAQMQRLTKAQYNNVVHDLFGLTADYTSGFAPEQVGGGGFTTEASGQTISSQTINDLWTASSAVTNDVFALPNNPVLVCPTTDDACVQQIVTALATKAYRRPATPDEVAALMGVYHATNGAAFTDALKTTVQAVLMSPQFFFQYYQTTVPNSEGFAYLSYYELASRMSLFIWGSIPDAPLLADAASGNLGNPTVIEKHVRRMLKSPKSNYLVGSFAQQWFGTAKFTSTTLSSTRFPDWNASLQAAMTTETQMFLQNIFVNDQSVMDLVNANYTFINKQLGDHYGIAGANDNNFVKVPLDSQHAGIMTQGSILAMNSDADHTTPVPRGLWVLANMLCAGTGPPPPGTPVLSTPPTGAVSAESQIRARLDAHVKQGVSCMACHGILDPIGLGFEAFDSGGVFRKTYTDGTPVDASGQMPGGATFKDLSGLKQIIATDPRFPSCFAAKMTSFAEGRDATVNTDSCSMKQLAAEAVGPNFKFSDAVVKLVTSPGFRARPVPAE